MLEEPALPLTHPLALPARLLIVSSLCSPLPSVCLCACLCQFLCVPVCLSVPASLLHKTSSMRQFPNPSLPVYASIMPTLVHTTSAENSPGPMFGITLAKCSGTVPDLLLRPPYCRQKAPTPRFCRMYSFRARLAVPPTQTCVSPSSVELSCHYVNNTTVWPVNASVWGFRFGKHRNPSVCVTVWKAPRPYRPASMDA